MSGPPPPTLPSANDWTLGNLAEFTIDTFTSHPNNSSSPAIYDISPTLKLAAANTSTADDLNEISMWLIDVTTPLSPTIGSRFTWSGTAAPSGGVTNFIYSLPAGFAVNGNGAYLYNVSGVTPSSLSGTFQISHFTFSGLTISYASSQTVPTAMRTFPIRLVSLSDDLIVAVWSTDPGTGSQNQRQYSLISTSGGTLGSIPSPTAAGVLANNSQAGPIVPSSLGTNGRTVFWHPIIGGPHLDDYQAMLHDGTLTATASISATGMPDLSGAGGPAANFLSWSALGTDDTLWWLVVNNSGAVSPPAPAFAIYETGLDAASGALTLTGTFETVAPPVGLGQIALSAPVSQSVHVPYLSPGIVTLPYEEATHTVASAWIPIIDQFQGPGHAALGYKYRQPPGAGPNGMLLPSTNLCQWGNLVACVGYWGTTVTTTGTGASIIVADALFVELFALSVDLATDAWIPVQGQVNFPGAVDRAWAWSVGQVLVDIPQNPEIL